MSEELAAKRRYVTIEQLEHDAVAELAEVVRDKASSLVLHLALPKAQRCRVMIVGLDHGIDNCLCTLPT